MHSNKMNKRTLPSFRENPKCFSVHGKQTPHKHYLEGKETVNALLVLSKATAQQVYNPQEAYTSQ